MHRVSQAGYRTFHQIGYEPNTSAGRRSHVGDLSYFDPVHDHGSSRLDALANVWGVDRYRHAISWSATEWIQHGNEHSEHDTEQRGGADERQGPVLGFF